MAKRISVSTLNASTIEILNVIRQNASLAYQNDVPKITKEADIPKVGEVLYGAPAHKNYFLNALINRIALVVVQSATFNNPYARLKKGYLEYGETVEEIFVNIAKVMKYDPEKGESREFKRYIPDVRSAFHIMNWRVVYPVTIHDDDLRQAFLSINGVQDMIARIVDSIYTAAEYDEFLLFKYLLIKAVAHGKMKPVSIGTGTAGSLDTAAVQFRGTSNILPFMATDYNESGVMNTTPKDRQIIFMDSFFNAQYDVEVLAGAFNMDKADFMGSLYLMDNWNSFDNERWAVIMQESDGVEAVSAAELALMADVKAVLVDERWFQVYDNNNKFTEKFVASGDYWNYFYHVWKTLSHSPFANAVCFVTSSASVTLPTSFTLTLDSKTQTAEAYILTYAFPESTPAFVPQAVQFVQTQPLTAAGIAVEPYGEIIVPVAKAATDMSLEINLNGTPYYAQTAASAMDDVADTIVFKQTKPTPPSGG